MDMLAAALWYQKKGFSVIPAKKDKRPFVKWEQYQKEPAEEVQVREWWGKWPNANIAIITGMKSNLTVIDADSEAGKNAVEDFLSDSFMAPVVKTPKGWHYYFKYVDGVSNGVRVLTDCDIRSEGGYVIAPPSDNGNQTQYAWVDGLSIKDSVPPQMPSFLSDLIANASSNERNKTDSNSFSIGPFCEQHEVTQSNISNILTKGRRDNDLFRVANCLIKGGMPKNEVSMYLNYIAKCCDPPFDEKEAELKVHSALKRNEKKSSISTQDIREWVSATTGNFIVTNLYNELHLQHKGEKSKARVILSRLVADGMIEKTGKHNGTYRRVENDAPKIDILNAKAEYLNIKYPLDIHEHFKTMQKNVIIIAGTQDVGKTAFLLNIVKMNMNRDMQIRYCSSEMGPSELRSRLELFQPEVPVSAWCNVDFRERSSNFQDMILPDGINVIDYLEISDAFYKVGDLIKEIFDRLGKGIAIVALQKAFKSDLGRGGEFSLEKPRLYVTLTANPPEGNIARIAKCKNWANPDSNPNNKECVFKIIQGSKIRMQIGWGYPIGKGKK